MADVCMVQVREASEAHTEQQQAKQQLESQVEQLQESLSAATRAKDAVQEAAQEKLARLSQLEGELPVVYTELLRCNWFPHLACWTASFKVPQGVLWRSIQTSDKKGDLTHARPSSRSNFSP